MSYESALKERLKKEGTQSVTNCHRLKLPVQDEEPGQKRGRIRVVDNLSTTENAAKNGNRVETC